MRESLSRYLLAKAITLVVSKAAQQNVHKASLAILSGNDELVRVEIIKFGSVFEACVASKHIQSSDDDRLTQQLLDQCFDELRARGHNDLSEKYHFVLCATMDDGTPSQVTKMWMGEEGQIRYSGIYGIERRILNRAVSLVRHHLQDDANDSARISVSDGGGKSITICVGKQSAYSNDFDLFAGGAPSFYLKESGKTLYEGIDTFLATHFADATRLRVRVTADGIANKRQAIELEADSAAAGDDFNSPVFFDPPV